MINQTKQEPQNSGAIVERDKVGRFVGGHKKIGGRQSGGKNFATLFDEAVKKIIREKKLPISNPEIELITRAIIEALKGNYPYYRDIMDRRFGRPKEQIDMASGGEPMGIIFLPRRKQDEGK